MVRLPFTLRVKMRPRLRHAQARCKAVSQPLYAIAAALASASIQSEAVARLWKNRRKNKRLACRFGSEVKMAPHWGRASPCRGSYCECRTPADDLRLCANRRDVFTLLTNVL